MNFLQQSKYDFPKILYSFIKFNQKTFGDYIIYTYSVKGTKNQLEDEIYNTHKELLAIVSRGHTIIVKNDKIVCILEGPTKFSGKSTLDEDPDEDNIDVDPNVNDIYNHNMILEWASKKQLKIIRTDKENGKFAIMTMFQDPDTMEPVIVFGSKNNHFVVKESEFFTQNYDYHIIKTIHEYIKNVYPIIKETLMSKFINGFTLVGELCDGQHFTNGDDKIRWFGLFKNGSPFEVLNTLQFLRDNNIDTVNFEQVYDHDHERNIDSIFFESRCMQNEGCVLYLVNIETNQTVLVKSKSVQYIVKRFMRQVILRGYTKIDFIRDRFVDASTYHGLNTDASIRVTNQLIEFGLWLMNMNYPTTIMGVTEVKSVKGQLVNGFHNYWKEYMIMTGALDIIITEADFGEFDKDIYLKNTQMYSDRDKQFNPIVVFTQGLQGSGKSTISTNLAKMLNENSITCKIIEQDICYGDTLAAQGQLYHWSSNGSNEVIIVSRCNINESHYKRYLDIAKDRKCTILFFTPDNFNDLYFAISIAGIMKRSSDGDKMMIYSRDDILLEADTGHCDLVNTARYYQ